MVDSRPTAAPLPDAVNLLGADVHELFEKRAHIVRVHWEVKRQGEREQEVLQGTSGHHSFVSSITFPLDADSQKIVQNGQYMLRFVFARTPDGLREGGIQGATTFVVPLPNGRSIGVLWDANMVEQEPGTYYSKFDPMGATPPVKHHSQPVVAENGLEHTCLIMVRTVPGGFALDGQIVGPGDSKPLAQISLMAPLTVQGAPYLLQEGARPPPDVGPRWGVGVGGGTIRLYDAHISPLQSDEASAPADDWTLPPGAPPPAVAPFGAAQAKKHQQSWADYLGKPLEVENFIGMRFMLIPPGEFEMGSTEEEVEQLLEEAKERQDPQWYIDQLPSEAPRHRVRITRPFYLGLYEVTQAEYQQVMGVSPSSFSAEGKEAAKVAGLDTSRHPVETVSWNDAKAFCEKLSAMPEEQTAGRVYVLPTEPQWEYACRAGTTTKWSCGDDGGVLRDYAWYGTNSGGRTHGVGEKKPNGFGLFDMHGNVREWCADWHAADYYAALPVNDPQGPVSGSSRVFRGGSWLCTAGICRSASRCRYAAVLRDSVLGFRLALVPVDESSK